MLRDGSQFGMQRDGAQFGFSEEYVGSKFPGDGDGNGRTGESSLPNWWTEEVPRVF